MDDLHDSSLRRRVLALGVSGAVIGALIGALSWLPQSRRRKL
jgi:hypothetical protein